MIPDTFRDPCCVQFLERWERKSDLTTAPLNSFMVTQIYCMSFQELLVHRLVKVPWPLTVIQMLFTIMDYVFAPVMTAGMLEIISGRLLFQEMPHSSTAICFIYL